MFILFLVVLLREFFMELKRLFSLAIFVTASTNFPGLLEMIENIGFLSGIALME